MSFMAEKKKPIYAKLENNTLQWRIAARKFI